ncbi:fibrous sheath-interacting protein 2 isoform X1 [Callithrix jacchus]
MISKTSSIVNDRGDTNISGQGSIISAQESPTRNLSRLSQAFLDPSKEEETNTNHNGKPTKRSSYLYKSETPKPNVSKQGSKMLAKSLQLCQRCFLDMIPTFPEILHQLTMMSTKAFVPAISMLTSLRK